MMARQTVSRARSIACALLVVVLTLCSKGAFAGASMESYISEVDGSQQPYGLYLPDPFDPDAPHPVVIHLHPGGGRADANFPNTSYANARGWIMVKPDGRRTHTLYAGIAENDIFRVLDELREKHEFKIDENRIYLTGTSSGAHGSFRLALTYPHVFAAAAAVDGWYDEYMFHEAWWAPMDKPDEVDPRRAPLLEGLSSLYVAENGKHLNLYLGVDTNDGTCPPSEAYKLHDRLDDLGYAHAFHEFPGGHMSGYNPSAIYQFFSEQVNDPRPQHVVLKANQLKYGSAYWARIERLEKKLDTGQFATIEAEVRERKEEVRVDVTATGLLQFALLLTPELIGEDEVSVYTNGALVYAGPPEEITVSASMDEPGNIIGWSTDHTLPRGLRKTAQIEGPIGHAYISRFLLAKGTIGSKSENSQNSSEAGKFAADWNLRNHANISLVTDTSITEPNIATSNLIVFGTADSNSIIKAINDLLPIRIWRDRIVAGANVYEGDNYGLYMIFPNPLNPERYVVISHGTIQGSCASDLIALPLFWPDYVVFDADIVPRPMVQPHAYGEQGAYLPDAWVEAGFFDQYWRLDNDEDGMDDIFEKDIIDADPSLTIEDVNPQDDFDGDGQDNRTEYNAGTGPTDPESYFSVLSVAPDPGDVANLQVSWKVAPGRSYYILWSDSMGGPWHEIAQLDPADISDDGEIRTWTDKGTDPTMEGKKPSDCPARFYKVAAYR